MLSAPNGTDPGHRAHAGAAVLEARGLSVHRGGLNVLRDLDLTVAAGERLGLIGESGSGKSTLGLSLLGLLGDSGRVSGGQIEFAGRDVAKLSTRELRRIRGREIALVYQDASTSLDPVKTIGAQLHEAIAAHERRRRRDTREEIRAALEAVAVASRHATSYPHQLSGGMCQRVAIAIALAQGPRLIVADEPTSALDVTTQARVLRLLDTLVAESGTALILITHDLRVVADHCDTTAVMYAGRVVEHGPTEELFARPRHPYTQALVEAAGALERPGLRRLPTLPGAPPQAGAMQRGPACAFAPRCGSHRGDPACLKVMPELRSVGGDADRRVACHHAVEGGPE